MRLPRVREILPVNTESTASWVLRVDQKLILTDDGPRNRLVPDTVGHPADEGVDGDYNRISRLGFVEPMLGSQTADEDR